ncbi:alpha/beta fold hydrolase [Streptomyces sp. NPDC052396]|uniref:alpha/beta fold hydrolase n=1 Tax=Streptomyces sp. NPDC052396 TaxID=3365689 RepID=UPI0037D7BCD1
MAIAHTLLGEGEHKVVALHGWLSDRTGYQPLWPYLDGKTFSYAFMDCRGYGEAMEVPGEFTLAEIAMDVLALADQLDWPEFSLVGHSMGGAAIQQVLVQAPQRVRKLVGLNPVPASGVPFDEEGWALFSGAADKAANRRAIIDITTGSRLSAAWLSAMTARSLERSRRSAFAAYLPQWAGADLASLVKDNPVPAKVLIGEHDPAISAELMRSTWLASYPNAELETIPNCGHYPMEEAPVVLLTAVEAFLRR